MLKLERGKVINSMSFLGETVFQGSLCTYCCSVLFHDDDVLL